MNNNRRKKKLIFMRTLSYSDIRDHQFFITRTFTTLAFMKIRIFFIQIQSLNQMFFLLQFLIACKYFVQNNWRSQEVFTLHDYELRYKSIFCCRFRCFRCSQVPLLGDVLNEMRFSWILLAHKTKENTGF